jgi:hypothetical protein
MGLLMCLLSVILIRQLLGCFEMFDMDFNTKGPVYLEKVCSDLRIHIFWVNKIDPEFGTNI